ncbi:MAG: aminoglycoside phosphotransferase family protein, partial [Cyclobacteriaceae bacterium]|nr:aminoglycoside phosphotransferase family protein [Cyclobacteriaceae bacterium]
LEWKGEYWRMFRFKEGMQSHDVPASTAEVFDAARAFAAFSEGLKDLSADTFSESIPGFQSMSLRLNQLENAIRGQHDLKRELSDELAFVEKVSGKFLELEGLWHSGQLPTRICHNDTKFNNVLFDKENQAKCVVDLDTVMPGILHFDLGDGLRTTASLAAEDEPDLRNVVIERERNDAYLAGYLEGFGGEITSLEREWMPVSGAYMAFIMGIRFLADHFNGDVYYKTKFRGHNLNRSRCQLHLTDLFLRQAFESGT